MAAKIDPLICPVCEAALVRFGQTIRCVQGHSFDLAREGYVNLSLQKRKRAVRGDSKTMLQARRQFLEEEHYAPLSDAINKLAASCLDRFDTTECKPPVIMDVGCGEGYYGGGLQAYLDGQALTAAVPVHHFGMDLAKEAARLAAKKYPNIFFMVADVNQKILLPDQAAHLLLNIFAPRNEVEFARVLQEQGQLLVVIPRPDHLQSLRQHLPLLNIDADKEQQVIDRLASNFQCVERQSVAIDLVLQATSLQALIRMTPTNWHLSDADWDTTSQIQQIETRAKFIILLFQKPLQKRFVEVKY